MPDTRIVTASVKENVAYMNQILPIQDSFDLIQRRSYDWRKGSCLFLY